MIQSLLLLRRANIRLPSRRLRALIPAMGFTFLLACSASTEPGPFGAGGHLVSGGVGPDQILALNNPIRISGDQMVSPFLLDSEMVEGVFINGEAMAYPVKMMDYHEIANDVVGGIPIVLSYCPLTATGIGFDRRTSAGTVQFGVSGLLCDNNLVMFDRATDSLWPQIGFQSIRGDLTGERLEQIQVFEMPWGAWKNLHPDTEVADFRELDNHINYGFYPYGTYYTSSAIFFPLQNVDSRLFPKERVHGIRVGGAGKVYPIDEMSATVVNDAVSGEPVVVFGHGITNYAVSYSRVVGQQVRTFESLQAFPARIRDLETGTVWDIHGIAISGPDSGKRLIPTESFNAFWFGWAAFNEESEIWSSAGN